MVSTASRPAGVRTSACPSVEERDDLTEASFVRAGDADLFGALGRLLLEQSGVLEADVGQLPEQVVEKDEPPGVGRRPSHRRPPTGRNRPPPGSGRRPAPIQTVSSPHARARCLRLVADGSSDRETSKQDVARTSERPQALQRMVLGDHDGWQRPLAHDDRVDELDRDVLGVRRPRRSHAPEGGSGGEPASHRKRGCGKVRAPVPGRRSDVTDRVILPRAHGKRAQSRSGSIGTPP